MSQAESQVLALHLTRAGADRIREMVSGSQVSQLIGLESSLEEFERKAIQLQPEILLVEYMAGHSRQAELLARLRVSASRSAVFTLSESSDPEDIVSAMRLGVGEYLTPKTTGSQEDKLGPASSLSLAAAFNEAALRLRKQAQTAGSVRGQMWAVMGSKGGVGCSTLVMNLAWALNQKLGRRVALVDLDLAAGDISFLLDLEPRKDMIDAVRNIDRLDPVLVDGLLTEIAPGLRLMAAPSDPVAAEEVTEDHVSRVIDQLLAGHELVLADVPSRVDAASVVALERADQIFIVMEASLPSIKAARRLVSLCERLGRDAERVQLVVNRFDSRYALGKSEVEKALGYPIMTWLPNEFRYIVQAQNSGRAILQDRPRAAWSKALVKMANHLVGQVLAEENEEEGGESKLLSLKPSLGRAAA